MEVNTRGLLEMWTWMASLGFLAMLQQFIPREYIDSLKRNFKLWFQQWTPFIFCDIPEFENAVSNSLYQDVEAYISSLRVEGAQRMSLCKTRNAKNMTFGLANHQRTLDTFDKAKVEWVFKVHDRNRPSFHNAWETQSEEKRAFTLQIGKKDKDRVLDRYMAHIEAKALELKLASRDLMLFTNTRGRDGFYFAGRRSGPWQSVPFKHPANFDTLALDVDLKSRVIADLDSFSVNEDYYKRIGKAWKRGYLLYGPPGTGKSSMIAAIANKMRYDVFDLELTEVSSNTDLRRLLLCTSNKSIIVIEDIDCSLDLSGQRKRQKKVDAGATTTPTTGTDAAPAGAPGKPRQENESSKVTLSGLLNFVDGLWSCCGQERIFIFTTNYVEKLDPALLRAGRMDMHIHLSYCTFSTFKQLAKNYLQITEHELFPKLEAAFVGTYMTPASVSELLILYQSESVDVVLEKIIAGLDEHRVDPATVKRPEEAEEEKSAAAPTAADSCTSRRNATSEKDHRGAKESPPSADVPEDKQQVVEATAPQAATDSAAADKVEPKDPLLADGLLSTEPQSDKELGVGATEIPEGTVKAVLVTGKESSAETQTVDKASRRAIAKSQGAAAVIPSIAV